MTSAAEAVSPDAVGALPGTVAGQKRVGRTLGAVGQIVLAWAVSRIVVLGAAALVQELGWPRAHWQPGFGRHPFALLTLWDGRWYKVVADHGYFAIPGHWSDPAFFPLLPLLLRGAAFFHIDVNLAGIALANGAFLVGLILFYRLSRTRLSESDSLRAVRYAAFFPMSFVFSMLYPESLAFALLVGAALLALRRRWLAAALCAALAGAARPEAFLFMLPLAATAASAWRDSTRSARGRSLVAVAAGPAALALFFGYLWWRLGDPLAWTHAEQAWGRNVSVAAVPRAFAGLLHSGALWEARDLAFTIVYVAALGVAFRIGIPRGWIALGLTILVLPLASGTFTSEARFGLLALPVYWGLAVLGRRPVLNSLFVVLSVLMLAGNVLTIALHSP